MKNTIIGVLIFASVISLFLIVERGLALRQSVIIPFRVVELQGICKTEDNLLTLRTTANKIQSPYSRLIACAIDHLHLTREENMEMLQTRARSEVARMERGIVVLEIITGIAPLLGLVGTIFGLITLFQGMGVEASAEQTALFSQGISIALKATLLGLVVAIPSLIGWSYFNRKVETLAIEMENLCDQFLYEQYRNND
ncbi:MAG: biopolymer transporter ExbB [Verrucomicrobiales bacterium]|nr:biopolymer transporter ExbB [Verrucomicrobiales bacterium]